MNYQELKAKLAEMGLPTSGNTATLQARYDAAITSANNSDAVAADADLPEKVICNGVELTPYAPDAPALKEYIAARRQREFPQLLAAVPNGEYETTGRFSLYPWNTINGDGEEVPTTLMVVEITNGTNSYFIGEWEFVSRTYGFTPQGGELMHPNWILNTLATGSLRTQAVLAMPAGTKCVKHSEVGRLTDKPGTRNYLCHWIAQD
jgi:hypothetical protein